MSLPPGDSPYATPQSQLRELTGPPSPERLATTGQRFANYAIDYVAILIAYVAFLLASGSEDVDQPGRDLLASLLIYAGYYLVFESLGGGTPGKWVTGTRVVAEDGSAPRFVQILGRSFARLLPLEPFSLLGGRGRPVGWHDSLSGTRVIRIR